MSAPTFATSSDVLARWPGKAFSAAEATVADTLCADASRRARGRWKTLDARISAGTLDPEDVRMVIATVVKRAMISSSNEGVTQSSNTMGPYSTSVTFANPTAAIYFSKEDIAMLSPGGTRMRSVKVVLAE